MLTHCSNASGLSNPQLCDKHGIASVRRQQTRPFRRVEPGDEAVTSRRQVGGQGQRSLIEHDLAGEGQLPLLGGDVVPIDRNKKR